MIDDEHINEFTCYLQWPLSYDFNAKFDRVLHPRWSRDVDQLRTWNMDIRQILAADPIRGVAVDMVALDDVQEMQSDLLPRLREVMAIDWGQRFPLPPPPQRDPAIERRRRQFLAGSS